MISRVEKQETNDSGEESDGRYTQTVVVWEQLSCELRLPTSPTQAGLEFIIWPRWPRVYSCTTQPATRSRLSANSDEKEDHETYHKGKGK